MDIKGHARPMDENRPPELICLVNSTSGHGQKKRCKDNQPRAMLGNIKHWSKTAENRDQWGQLFGTLKERTQNRSPETITQMRRLQNGIKRILENLGETYDFRRGSYLNHLRLIYFRYRY